ncbi:hypothetical protein FA15DRAFT_131119 [Coprinopsis marcescibilis]|uniref:Uncharacterized protein n=1 Tax=Coprinopsis marcescibilis TaxID=230819 RepID=A0A5C3KJK5_COPMA|nr:hypothetical protein FA15DRAFT_131119 [Coprinopsis marcescibilis]
MTITYLSRFHRHPENQTKPQTITNTQPSPMPHDRAKSTLPPPIVRIHTILEARYSLNLSSSPGCSPCTALMTNFNPLHPSPLSATLPISSDPEDDWQQGRTGPHVPVPWDPRTHALSAFSPSSPHPPITRTRTKKKKSKFAPYSATPLSSTELWLSSKFTRAKSPLGASPYRSLNVATANTTKAAPGSSFVFGKKQKRQRPKSVKHTSVKRVGSSVNGISSSNSAGRGRFGQRLAGARVGLTSKSALTTTTTTSIPTANSDDSTPSTHHLIPSLNLPSPTLNLSDLQHSFTNALTSIPNASTASLQSISSYGSYTSASAASSRASSRAPSPVPSTITNNITNNHNNNSNTITITTNRDDASDSTTPGPYTYIKSQAAVYGVSNPPDHPTLPSTPYARSTSTLPKPYNPAASYSDPNISLSTVAAIYSTDSFHSITPEWHGAVREGRGQPSDWAEVVQVSTELPTPLPPPPRPNAFSRRVRKFSLPKFSAFSSSPSKSTPPPAPAPSPKEQPAANTGVSATPVPGRPLETRGMGMGIVITVESTTETKVVHEERAQSKPRPLPQVTPPDSPDARTQPQIHTARPKPNIPRRRPAPLPLPPFAPSAPQTSHAAELTSPQTAATATPTQTTAVYVPNPAPQTDSDTPTQLNKLTTLPAPAPAPAPSSLHQLASPLPSLPTASPRSPRFPPRAAPRMRPKGRRNPNPGARMSVVAEGTSTSGTSGLTQRLAASYNYASASDLSDAEPDGGRAGDHSRPGSRPGSINGETTSGSASGSGSSNGHGSDSAKPVLGAPKPKRVSGQVVYANGFYSHTSRSRSNSAAGMDSPKRTVFGSGLLNVSGEFAGAAVGVKVGEQGAVAAAKGGLGLDSGDHDEEIKSPQLEVDKVRSLKLAIGHDRKQSLGQSLLGFLKSPIKKQEGRSGNILLI